MMKLRKILIIFLIVIEFFSVSLTIKSYLNKKNITLIKAEDNISNAELAIFINDGDGYIPQYSSDFPTDRELNTELSACFDNDNNRLVNALSYKDGIVEVNTTKSCYCYLYFEEENLYSNALGEYLLKNPTAGLNTELEAGLYRYQGSSVNNYVCFGTTNKSTCLNHPSTYMYRIIGIDTEGKVKLVKESEIGGKNNYYIWAGDDQTESTWPSGSAYSSVNGGAFLSSTTYVPSGWANKIASVNWKHGKTTSLGEYTGNKMYTIENGFSDLVYAKVGLLYIHDLYYAAVPGGNIGSASRLSSSWLKNNSGKSVWLITRYGVNWDSSWGDGTYEAWAWNSGLSTRCEECQGVLKPVFFLEKNVEYSSGTGTSTDPYIIN